MRSKTESGTSATIIHSLLILLVIKGLACGAEPDSRPNIVLVMADDLGWSDVGCYGGEIGTPNIDSLAAEGLRFTQFYNNSVCGPTRASLLTGLYCQRIGHRGNHWNDPKDFSRCATISELLQRSGYRTMMVGKWQGRDPALERGFDRFFGPMCQAKISYFHEVEQNPFYLDHQRWNLPDDFYLTDAFNDRASEFLSEAVGRDEPFFLYVAHIAPHWPLHAREAEIQPLRAKYRDRGWDQLRQQRFARQRELGIVPDSWTLSPQPSPIGKWQEDKHKVWQAERMAVYAAQVTAIDRGLGQLLRIIDDAGKRENTLVIFLSDNGAAPDGGLAPTKSGFGFGPNANNNGWRKDGVAIRPGSGPENLPGPHDTFAAYGLAWAGAGNTPLRGTKLTAYEGGIRTPLVVRWPAELREHGAMTDHIGHVIDFMPTLLEAAVTPYPRRIDERDLLPLDGKSLMPAFRSDNSPGHDSLCWSVPRHHAIRMGRWKAIRPRAGGAWQLFDLQNDGTESTDLAEQEPQRVKAMERRFEAWQLGVNVVFRSAK